MNESASNTAPVDSAAAAAIRLVASDMDGTLLAPSGELPQETFALIDRLHDAGVHFVAASGRRFDTLQAQFAPVADRIDFVAANGAQVVVGGRLIDKEVFSHAAIRRLERAVALFDTLHLALFDDTRSFLMDDESRFEREFDKNLPLPVRMFDVPSPEVNIIKASVYCDESIMDMAYALARELDDDFVFAPSGNKWIDVMQRGVNKATGIRQVMEARGIDGSEVMAFGDSMNDYEILRMVGISFAMENGRSAIKQIADHVIGSNAQQSVQREIEALLAVRGC